MTIPGEKIPLEILLNRESVPIGLRVVNALFAHSKQAVVIVGKQLTDHDQASIP
jgi:hypothetical protein